MYCSYLIILFLFYHSLQDCNYILFCVSIISSVMSKKVVYFNYNDHSNYDTIKYVVTLCS